MKGEKMKKVELVKEAARQLINKLENMNTGSYTDGNSLKIPLKNGETYFLKYSNLNKIESEHEMGYSTYPSSKTFGVWVEVPPIVKCFECVNDVYHYAFIGCEYGGEDDKRSEHRDCDEYLLHIEASLNDHEKFIKNGPEIIMLVEKWIKKKQEQEINDQ